MSTVTTNDGVTIFYKDWGSKNAQPIVFHHGWPLSADDWDTQMLYFLGKGYRVVAQDRREGVAERDRQLVASGDDGRRERPLRWHQSLLGDGLHRRSEEDRRADARHAWRRRPDRPDR